jgi:hypothetical protein
MYTPGKATSLANDQNWPTDFKIPTGTPAVDSQTTALGQTRVRVFEIGQFDGPQSFILHQRNVDSDTNLIDASSEASPVLGIVGDDTGGSTADSPKSVYDDPGTITLENNGTLERGSGYNGIILPP